MGHLGQRLPLKKNRELGSDENCSLLERLQCTYSFSESTKEVFIMCMERGTLQTC
jgi:hypothetical protein